MSVPTDAPTTGDLSRRLLARLRPHAPVALGVLAGLLAEAAFDVVFPLAVKLLIDAAVAGAGAGQFSAIVVGLMVAFVVGMGGALGRDYFAAQLGARVLSDLRADLFRHLQRLSADFYARHDVGDLIARFSGDLNAVEGGVRSALPSAVYRGVGVLVGVPLLFALDWRLSVVTLVVLPASALGPRLFGGRAAAAGYARREEEGRAIAQAQEAIVGQPVIRAFGWHRAAEARFGAQLARVAAVTHQALFLQRMVGRVSYVGTTLGQVVIIGVGAALVLNGTMTVGTLVGFIGLLLNVGASVDGVASSVPEWLQSLTGFRRIDEVLREQPRVQDRPGAAALDAFRGELRFAGVSFGYGPERLNVRDVTLAIGAGQNVAFVGRSGSGKSTLFNLLTRFYDPDRGAITIDGRDYRDLTQDSLRAPMGVVFQDSFLFRGSVRDNIRVGKPDATDAEVEAAARAAQIHEIVMGLPGGYDADVGERGGQLSGGQRQRIALARALVRDPAILLLDEATSALDPATEAAFNETLAAIGAGKTVVSVTHRLSTAAGADRVFVMDEGQLVEQGTHAELLALGGVYAAMWRRQQESVAISRDGRRAVITPAGLRAIPLFSALDEEHLAAVAGQFSSERLPPDRVIFAQGDVGDRFYVLAHGSVEVSQVGADGAERRLRVLQDGDVFGELALLHDAPRSATVRTVTPCLLLTLSAQEFATLLETVPGLRAAVEQVAETRA